METENVAMQNKKSVWKILKKVFLVFVLFLCAVLLFIGSWLAVDKFIRKSPVPSFAGYSLLSVESGSMSGNMEDSIEKGDLVIIQKTDDYKIGETVTFLRAGEIVPTTHRIIDFDYSNGVKEYVTRGDANFTRDKNVSESEILGEVVIIFKNFGVFRAWFTEGGGYIFVLSAIAILGVGVFLLKYV